MAGLRRDGEPRFSKCCCYAKLPLVPEFLQSWPYWLAFVFLFALAMARGQAVYWVGRVATEQTLKRTHPATGWRRRTHDWLAAGGADPGVAAIKRWGLAAVPVSYITVGFQSMVQAGAGILRIEVWKYALAQIPGALAWATIYATIGFAAWEAVLAGAAGSPLGMAAIIAIVIVVVTTVVLMRRRRSARERAETHAIVTDALND